MFAYTGNGKPTFLTPQKIVKVINEDLVLSIVARDPEDRPVSYNLVFATDPEITVNASGEMRWPSHGRGDKMIEVGLFVCLFVCIILQLQQMQFMQP